MVEMETEFENCYKAVRVWCRNVSNVLVLFVFVQAGWYEFDEDATLNRAITIVNTASAVRLSTLITFRTAADPAMGGPGGRPSSTD